LGPQLAKSFPKTKIFIFDHNKDHAPYWIDTIMKDKEVAKYVGGTAYHWYAGSMDRLLDGAQGAPNMHRIMAQLDHIFLDQKTLDSHHNRDTSSSTGSPIPHIVLGSEACHCPTTGYAGGDIAVAWARAERYAHSILADLAAGSQGWVEWNLLLDAMGGPNHLGNLCDASLLAVPHRAISANDTAIPPIDFQHGRRPFGRIVGEGRTREELNALGFPASLLDMGIVAQPLFYYMGHISRYVRPGSHAIPAIAVEGSTSSLQTVFRTQDGVAGGGENNLARQGIELTVWPCEGSTRQQFVWNDTTQQIQVLGHDWLGIPTVSCVGRQNDKDFLGVQLGSCNVTVAFAGTFEKVDVVSDDDDDNNIAKMRLQLVNFQSDDNEKRCLIIQKLHNNGGANGPRGGAQVAIGGCDSDASLWNWDNGEVTSTYMDEGRVCMTTGWPFLQVSAFDTPGPNAAAEKAVVVLNEASQSANYILKNGNTIIMSGSIPPHSIQTILID
jgi:glucosylceramidase